MSLDRIQNQYDFAVELGSEKPNYKACALWLAGKRVKFLLTSEKQPGVFSVPVFHVVFTSRENNIFSALLDNFFSVDQPTPLVTNLSFFREDKGVRCKFKAEYLPSAGDKEKDVKDVEEHVFGIENLIIF